MKCRILKMADGTFTAQYMKSNKWRVLKRKEYDQRDGDYVVDFYPTASAAEHALRDYAASKEPKVVKEFET